MDFQLLYSDIVMLKIKKNHDFFTGLQHEILKVSNARLNFLAMLVK